MGIAEYFLWFFLPLETKSASMQSLPLLWRDRFECYRSNSHTKFLVLPWDTFSTTIFHLSSLSNQPIHLWFFRNFPSPHSLVGESGRHVSHTDKTIFFQGGEGMSWTSSYAIAWLKMLQETKQGLSEILFKRSQIVWGSTHQAAPPLMKPRSRKLLLCTASQEDWIFSLCKWKYHSLLPSRRTAHQTRQSKPARGNSLRSPHWNAFVSKHYCWGEIT